MKKRYDDGEQVQGTPEEIAEYDRLRRQRKDEGAQQAPAAGKKPGVLKGKEISEFLKELQETEEYRRLVEDLTRPATCGCCGLYRCPNHWHIWYVQPEPQRWPVAPWSPWDPNITLTGTGTTIETVTTVTVPEKGWDNVLTAGNTVRISA